MQKTTAASSHRIHSSPPSGRANDAAHHPRSLGSTEVVSGDLKPALQMGDVISCETLQYGHPKFGIYLGEGMVSYVRLAPKSKTGRVTVQPIHVFCDGGGICIEPDYTERCKYGAYSRYCRARSSSGKIWGTTQDENPTRSFVVWVVNGTKPPNEGQSYKLAVLGGLLGFYVAGMGGAVCGTALGSLLGSEKP